MKDIYDIIGFSKTEVENVIDEINKYYLSYPIKKASGKNRWIDAPLYPLKEMQKNILRNLIYRFTAHPAAVGFVKGKNAKSGAKAHLGNNTLVCMDLSNFFNSIKTHMVYRTVQFMLERFAQITRHAHFTWNVADLDNLVQLLTYKGMLPQGSPASPAVANLYCVSMDRQLKNYCDKIGVTYTRYADDLAFSHNNKKFDSSDLIKYVTMLVKQFYFEVNTKKTRTLRQHKRMLVTGVLINNKLGVPKNIWKNLRAHLHNLLLSNSSLTLVEYQQLRGKIEWIKSLHYSRGANLLKSLGKIPLTV